MAKMILAEAVGTTGRRCQYGCCGVLPASRWIGQHTNITKSAIKRALKRRDRQSARAEIRAQLS